MPQLLDDKIKESIVNTIKKALPDVSVIYLFGSFAKGDPLKTSDIDIAILCPSPIGNVKLWQMAQSLSSSCGRDIDIVDLRQASAVMRIQIVAEGKHLFDDGNPESALFEDFVFSDYARLNEERQKILEDIGKRENIYG